MLKEYTDRKTGDTVLAVEVKKGVINSLKKEVKGEMVDDKGMYEYLERPYRAVVKAPRTPEVGDFLMEGEDNVCKLVSPDAWKKKYNSKRVEVF